MKQLFKKIAVTATMIAGSLGSFATGNANVQVIHNCAAPAADTVDVYVNGALTLTSFAFRTATSFLPLPAGVTYNIGIAAAHSTSVMDTLKNFAVGPLSADSNYIVVASGVVGTGFAANPNGVNTALSLDVIAHAQTTSTTGNISIEVFHGATDAPAVDVDLTGGATLVSNIEYGQSQGYLTVPAATYYISVAPTGTQTYVASYEADLTALAGDAVVVLASGFLTPASNNNGPAFGLWAALPAGGNLIPLTNVTGINNISSEIGLKYFPNPTTGMLNVDFHSASDATVSILDLNGNVIQTAKANAGENSLNVNMSAVSEGMYILHIVSASGSANEKFVVAK